MAWKAERAGFEPAVEFDPHTAFPVINRVGSSPLSHLDKGIIANGLRHEHFVNRQPPGFRKLLCKPEVSSAVRQFVNRRFREGKAPLFRAMSHTGRTLLLRLTAGFREQAQRIAQPTVLCLVDVTRCVVDSVISSVALPSIPAAVPIGISPPSISLCALLR